jgi:carbamate kinase
MPPSQPLTTHSILIALGGNAISVEGEEGNIEQQFAHTAETMREVVQAITGRYRRVVITHGNGPQVGNILMRSEMAAPALYPLPLDTCVSDSEGGMGYMLQQVLHNELCGSPEVRPVVSVLTQTVVSSDDPNWKNPTKFIGQFYTETEAQGLMAQRGWRMKRDGNRGWRRVVPSPAPVEIVEAEAIRALADSGVVVIAAGGGGIPVIRDAKGRLHGAEAVVDKDLASALLANLLGINTLVILTGVEQVAINYGKPAQRALPTMTIAEARAYLIEGQFPAGSMGPKIEAAVQFIERGGEEILITTPTNLCDALAGKTGTRVTV